jgi:energy-coupling factor transport system permease protein
MMARFQYLKGDSFFHRMDPTWKFVWNFVAVGTVILNFAILYSVSWLVYVFLLAMFAAGIPFKQYVRSILFFVGIAVFMGVWDSIYYAEEAHVLFAWGPINVTQEGVLEGTGVVFRVLVIASLSIMFTLTTDPGRMVESLIQVAKIPYRIGYTAYAVLRFIPLYENEAQVIINAHQIRGVGETAKNFWSRAKLYRSMLIPLLVSGIRRAQAASIAMDSRGFGAFPERTNLRETGVSKSTMAFVLFHIVFGAVAFIYFIILGRGSQHLG